MKRYIKASSGYVTETDGGYIVVLPGKGWNVMREYDDNYHDYYPIIFRTEEEAQEALDEYMRASEDDPIEVQTKHGTYYIWRESETFKGSTQHPNSYIVDARKIQKFDDFNSIDEVVEYVKKYF